MSCGGSETTTSYSIDYPSESEITNLGFPIVVNKDIGLPKHEPVVGVLGLCTHWF